MAPFARRNHAASWRHTAAGRCVAEREREREREGAPEEHAAACLRLTACLLLSLASSALRPAPACHHGGEDGLRLGDVGWSHG